MSNDTGIVAESDLTYTPPEQIDESAEAMAALQASIKEIEGEFQDDEAAQWLDPDEEKVVEEQTEEKAVEKPQDEDESLDPKLARSLERSVQREMAAKEAEKALQAREAALDAKLTEYRQYQGLKKTAEIQAKLETDPLGALKDMGKNPEDIIKLAIAQQVMAKGPPDDPEQLKTYNELKEFHRDYATRREIDALKAQIAEQNRAVAAQSYFNNVAASVRENVTKLGDSTPTLAKLSKQDAELAYSDLMEVIIADAKARSAEDPDGEPMSFEQAAKKVEERLARYAKYLVQTDSTTTQATTQAQKPIGKLPPQTKPPVKPLKPLAPWQKSNDELLDQGIAEAMREFHRTEAAMKQKRF